MQFSLAAVAGSGTTHSLTFSGMRLVFQRMGCFIFRHISREKIVPVIIPAIPLDRMPAVTRGVAARISMLRYSTFASITMYTGGS